jgi:hypothetical protein
MNSYLSLFFSSRTQPRMTKATKSMALRMVIMMVMFGTLIFDSKIAYFDEDDAGNIDKHP